MRKSNVFGIHVEGASHVWRTLMVDQMSRRYWTSSISSNVAISFTSPVSFFASFLYYESLKIRMRYQVCLSCIDIHSIRNHRWRQNLIKPDVIYRMCISSKSRPISLSFSLQNVQHNSFRSFQFERRSLISREIDTTRAYTYAGEFQSSKSCISGLLNAHQEIRRLIEFSIFMGAIYAT